MIEKWTIEYRKNNWPNCFCIKTKNYVRVYFPVGRKNGRRQRERTWFSFGEMKYDATAYSWSKTSSYAKVVFVFRALLKGTNKNV